MKWQDFYFGWLEKIGYYDWFNALLVENKKPAPVGARNNIGTVGFGGEFTPTYPSVKNVPNNPIVQHPAQTLITAELRNSEPLSPMSVWAGDRYYRNTVQPFSDVAMETIRNGLTWGEKNTLRYWGVQPNGQTLAASANFYRGFAYYTNAMKQKKELRGRDDSVLVQGTKKQWFSDKNGRTYPSLKMITSAPMVATFHPEYEHYSDVGKIMELQWGDMRGLQYAIGESGSETGLTDERNAIINNYIVGGPATEWIRGTNPMNDSMLSGQDNGLYDVMPRLMAPGYDGEPAENISPEYAPDHSALLTDQEKTDICEINAYALSLFAENKGLMVRSKRFQEIAYIKDKVTFEVRKKINDILLSIDSDMTVPTAEVILQILTHATVGVGFDGTPKIPPLQALINNELLPLCGISLEVQKRLKRLIQMIGPVTDENQNYSNSTQALQSQVACGSYYYDFEMDKSQFSTLVDNHGARGWSWNSATPTISKAKNITFNNLYPDSISKASQGAEKLFSNQQTGAPEIGLWILRTWADIEVVGESLMPLIEGLTSQMQMIITEDPSGSTLSIGNQQTIKSFTNLEWLYSIPTWTNTNYAIAVADSEMSHAASLDWQPKDISFRINGRDQYMYELKLSDWIKDYKTFEPVTTNQKYWQIENLFVQPITTKVKGESERTLEGLHQIMLSKNTIEHNARTRTTHTGESMIPANYAPNNIGIIECEAIRGVYDGVLTIDNYPKLVYEFWSEYKEWPTQNIPIIATPIQQSGEGQGVGRVHTYLTPMDNNVEWWTQFMDAESGVLSMMAARESSLTVGATGVTRTTLEIGWDIGWNWVYMDSVIQYAKMMDAPWAQGLTLEEYANRVYPSDTVVADFYPKIELTDIEYKFPTNLSEWDIKNGLNPELAEITDDDSEDLPYNTVAESQLLQNKYILTNGGILDEFNIVPTSGTSRRARRRNYNNRAAPPSSIKNKLHMVKKGVISNPFLPFSVRGNKDFRFEGLRLHRTNQIGPWTFNPTPEALEAISRINKPLDGSETIDVEMLTSGSQGWENYIANGDGYVPLQAPNDMPKGIGIRATFVANGDFSVNRGVIPFAMYENTTQKKGVGSRLSFTLMENRQGNLVAMPKYEPYWSDPVAWETAVGGAYATRTLLMFGFGQESAEALSREEEYEPTYDDAPKIFMSDLPHDILEVEEIPESYIGRNINYTIAGGNPWRRGKIPIINWCAILSKAILRMVTPPEE